MKKLLLIMILICSSCFSQDDIIYDIEYDNCIVGSYTPYVSLPYIEPTNKFIFANCCEIDTSTGEVTLLNDYDEKIAGNKSAKLFWECFEATFKSKIEEERAKEYLNTIRVPIEEYERLTKIDRILKDIYEQLKRINNK